MSFLSLDNVNRKKFYNSGGGRWWGGEKVFILRLICPRFFHSLAAQNSPQSWQKMKENEKQTNFVRRPGSRAASRQSSSNKFHDDAQATALLSLEKLCH
jgi:hypothetical protein